MPITDAETLRTLLGYDTIAVVGCSTTEGKAAHDIPVYLSEHGYDIIPVNPYADKIIEKRAFDSLPDVPDQTSIDIVEVFRPSEEAPEIVAQAIARQQECGDLRAVWLQRDIQHEEAAARAEAAGLQFVQDRCMKTDHGQLLA